MKRLLLAGFIIALFLVTLTLERESKPEQVEINSTTISVEIADSEKERKEGLSGWEKLEKDEGMLFIFDEKDRHAIWMKDMDFSIDIIWLDEKGKVVDLKRNASPESYPNTFFPKDYSLYVLELRAGLIEKLDIELGEQINFN